MIDLAFHIAGVEPELNAAVPTLRFALRIEQTPRRGSEPAAIHSIALQTQVRIEPARRRYDPAEIDALVDLFSAPDRWGQTVRPLAWTSVGTVVPSFVDSTEVGLSIPCSHDFTLAATRYFDALEGGEVPLAFLFSGTVFYAAETGALQAAPIPWDREASSRLDVGVWKDLMNRHYPDSVWLRFPRSLFDRLAEQTRRSGAASWQQALESLLAERKEAAS